MAWLINCKNIIANTFVKDGGDSSDFLKADGSSDSNAYLTSADLLNYVPKFEAVSDVCSPTATFKGEFNPQGLNYPEGFNNVVVGSPLE
jgi:hypothetical protein